ncbi:MAG: hypothetical protein K9L64_04290 [Candidatus Izimaplasma sp.]|nr:hypothetical protein [Candidatus Izimaplasma bacterium]
MKIRTGFVSNSSSSSFVITGRDIKFDEIDFNNLNNIKVRGQYLCDGQDIFNLTQEIYDVINADRSYLSQLNFIEQYNTLCDEYNDSVKEDIIIHKGTKVYLLDSDYHGTADVESFIRTYGE